MLNILKTAHFHRSLNCMIFKAMCFVMILSTNSFVNFKRWVKIIVAWKNISRSLQLIQRYFELMYQFALVFNPFMLSGNERLNILKLICGFWLQIRLWLFWRFVTIQDERVNYLQNYPHKNCVRWQWREKTEFPNV